MIDHELLSKYLNGTASELEREKVLQWLRADKANVKELAALRRINDISIWNQPEKPAKTSLFTKQFIYRIISVSAIVILLLGINLLYLFRSADNAMQTIHVPPGQRVELTLGDGTKVWLNARTTLEFPVSFGRKERLVKLDGEAYFDVTENRKRPFVVETSESRIEVTGTTFNVVAYAESNTYEVALIEGSVDVRVGNDAVTLASQHKICMENGAMNITRIDDYNPYRWKEGLICFTKESFHEIIHKLQNSYDVKLIMLNTTIHDGLYTGKFRITDGVDYALRVLQKDIRFEYDWDDENHVVYIR